MTTTDPGPDGSSLVEDARAGSLLERSTRRYLEVLRPIPDAVRIAMRTRGAAAGIDLPGDDELEALVLLVRLARPERVLEFGTGVGLRTLAVARELPPSGVLASFEEDPILQGEAHAFLHAHELEAAVELRLGSGLDSLHEESLRSLREHPGAAERGGAPLEWLDGPADLALLGDDPAVALELLELVLAHLAPGGLVIAGGALQRGAVGSVDHPGMDVADAVHAARSLNRRLVTDPRLDSATIIPVGDGLAVARRTRMGD